MSENNSVDSLKEAAIDASIDLESTSTERSSKSKIFKNIKRVFRSSDSGNAEDMTRSRNASGAFSSNGGGPGSAAGGAAACDSTSNADDSDQKIITFTEEDDLGNDSDLSDMNINNKILLNPKKRSVSAQRAAQMAPHIHLGQNEDTEDDLGRVVSIGLDLAGKGLSSDDLKNPFSSVGIQSHKYGNNAQDSVISFYSEGTITDSETSNSYSRKPSLTRSASMIFGKKSPKPISPVIPSPTFKSLEDNNTWSKLKKSRNITPPMPSISKVNSLFEQFLVKRKYTMEARLRMNELDPAKKWEILYKSNGSNTDDSTSSNKNEYMKRGLNIPSPVVKLKENSPKWFVSKLITNELSLKQFQSLSKYLKKNMEFVKNFILLQGTIALCITLQNINKRSIKSNEQLDKEFIIVTCLKDIINYKEGADSVFELPRCIHGLVLSLVSPRLSTRIQVSEILMLLTYWRVPLGRKTILEGLALVQDRLGDFNKFEPWLRIVDESLNGKGIMGNLISNGDYSKIGYKLETTLKDYSLVTLFLVNALLESFEDYTERLQIRESFNQSGILSIFNKMKLLKCGLINEQIEKYEDFSNEDFDDVIHSKDNGIEPKEVVTFKDLEELINDVFLERLKNYQDHAEILRHLHAIVNNLSLVLSSKDLDVSPTDNAIKYFKVIDAILTHIVKESSRVGENPSTVLNMTLQRLMDKLTTEEIARKAIVESQNLSRTLKNLLVENDELKATIELGSDGMINRLQREIKLLADKSHTQEKQLLLYQTKFRNLLDEREIDKVKFERASSERASSERVSSKSYSGGTNDSSSTQTQDPIKGINNQNFMASNASHFDIFSGLFAKSDSTENNVVSVNDNDLGISTNFTTTHNTQLNEAKDVEQMEAWWGSNSHEKYANITSIHPKLPPKSVGASNESEVEGNCNVSAQHENKPLCKVGIAKNNDLILKEDYNQTDETPIYTEEAGIYSGLSQSDAKEECLGETSTEMHSKSRVFMSQVSDSSTRDLKEKSVAVSPTAIVPPLSVQSPLQANVLPIQKANKAASIPPPPPLPPSLIHPPKSNVTESHSTLTASTSSPSHAEKETNNSTTPVKVHSSPPPPPPLPPSFCSNKPISPPSHPTPLPTASPNIKNSAAPPPPPLPPSLLKSDSNNDASIPQFPSISPAPSSPAKNVSVPEKQDAEAFDLTSESPLTIKQLPRPKTKLKQIHWDKIENSRIDHTFWKDLNDNSIASNLEKLGILNEVETFFAAKQSVSKFKIESKADTSKKKVSFLSRDLNQQFGINLHILGNMSEEELVLKVLHCDEKIMQNINILEFFNKDELTDFSATLRKNFAPYSTNFKDPNSKPMKDPRDLGRADRIFLELCFNLNGYWKARSRSLLFIKTYEKGYYDLVHKLDVIDEGIKSIRQSDSFKDVLDIIRTIGNFMNDDSKKALGFKLGTLQRLKFMKDDKNSMTFLHYIEKIIRNWFPEYGEFVDDLSIVGIVSKLSIDQLEADSLDFDKQVNNCKMSLEKGNLSDSANFHPEDKILEIISKPLERAVTKNFLLQQHLKSTTNGVHDLLEYFGESCKERSSFFGILANFIDDFKKAHLENIQKEEEERAYQKRKKMVEESKNRQKKNGIVRIPKSNKSDDYDPSKTSEENKENSELDEGKDNSELSISDDKDRPSEGHNYGPHDGNSSVIDDLLERLKASGKQSGTTLTPSSSSTTSSKLKRRSALSAYYQMQQQLKENLDNDLGDEDVEIRAQRMLKDLSNY
ncbi:hypothetical protein PACTADRAFT_49333 [Pachysolen tannophilus NRRL Y-2460]|uniref:Cytokinesis protein sepA n=1 Tax=Pachysolen tannophilus NRRL Y-2460 TaxID=669874 RepID=A0A1E4TVV5_PACTA|nr:hypothetical protein PACTADRAFT_49333 [Pachysolen tannophilus NRRL Y-2460]